MYLTAQVPPQRFRMTNWSPSNKERIELERTCPFLGLLHAWSISYAVVPSRTEQRAEFSPGEALTVSTGTRSCPTASCRSSPSIHHPPQPIHFLGLQGKGRGLGGAGTLSSHLPPQSPQHPHAPRWASGTVSCSSHWHTGVLGDWEHQWRAIAYPQFLNSSERCAKGSPHPLTRKGSAKPGNSPLSSRRRLQFSRPVISQAVPAVYWSFRKKKTLLCRDPALGKNRAGGIATPLTGPGTPVLLFRAEGTSSVKNGHC